MGAVENAAEALGVGFEIVLKDFAVFGLLKELKEGGPEEVWRRLVFKGGTSLSKAYQLVNRFSEDVDLAFMNHVDSGLSRLGQGPQDRLLKSVGEFVKDLEWIESVTDLNKTQGKRIVACKYKRPAGMPEANLDPGLAGYLKPFVQLELDIRGEAFPTVDLLISSLLGEYIKSMNPAGYAQYSGLHPILVRVMAYERTLIEKTLALLTCISNFSSSEVKARFSVKEKERHFYDIHCLYRKFKADGGSMAGEEFLRIFRSSVEQDGRIYRSQNYQLGANGLPLLEEKIEQFLAAEFRAEYKRQYRQSPIYFGDRLDAEEILEGVGEYLQSLRKSFESSAVG